MYAGLTSAKLVFTTPNSSDIIALKMPVFMFLSMANRHLKKSAKLNSTCRLLQE
jgi:hypothetical protein